MIFVLNCGSLSIKYKVFNNKLQVQAQNKIKIKHRSDHSSHLKRILNKIKQDFSIDIVGHRVVHGGPNFFEPVKINKNVLKKIESVSYLAPLHNPYNLAGIKAVKKFWPNTEQAAVFDTGFYHNLPVKAKYYALPQKWRKQFPRYGFHGLSHEYVINQASKKLNKPLKQFNAISVHLGGGASISAFKNGQVIDTSMGFTPLEGLVMMTRCGNIDPGIVLELSKQFGPEKAGEILNKKSGLLGLCQTTNMKKILKRVKQKEKKFNQAFELYCYHIKKFVGSYFFVLQGQVDALIFTGSIGAGKPLTRQTILSDIKHFFKKSKILTIKTNEEKLIAQKIKDL